MEPSSLEVEVQQDRRRRSADDRVLDVGTDDGRDPGRHGFSLCRAHGDRRGKGDDDLQCVMPVGLNRAYGSGVQ